MNDKPEYRTLVLVHKGQKHPVKVHQTVTRMIKDVKREKRYWDLTKNLARKELKA